jgi:hypothetical protein
LSSPFGHHPQFRRGIGHILLFAAANPGPVARPAPWLEKHKKRKKQQVDQQTNQREMMIPF